VCEDPAVLLRLLATGRALGDEAAAAARGRLRLVLGPEDEYDDTRLRREECQRLCREQAAFVERRGALLAELAVADASIWHHPYYSDHKGRPIESVLPPALQRAAAAGRLGGLRAMEVAGCGLRGGLLGALALCPALTRLRLGTFGQQDNVYDTCVYLGGGRPSVKKLRAFGGQLAALRGLRELDLAFGCEAPAAPVVAGLSSLTRLTRLRLTLVGLPEWATDIGKEGIEMTREWSGVHNLPASLLDLTLAARAQVRGVVGPGRRRRGGGQ
jgi:hypothetical protein